MSRATSAPRFATGLMADIDPRFNPVDKVENNLHELRHSNRSAAQAKANARAHYGLGTEFYRLWLDDPLLMYTCGYWSEGTHTLEQAQRNKIDHVCRKIRLAPGERFVDIGCGFGGFMLRAHETLGAIGTGINTTHRAGAMAARRDRAAWAGRRAAGARGRFSRARRPLRQGGVDRRARTCRARPAGRGHRAPMPTA